MIKECVFRALEPDAWMKALFHERTELKLCLINYPAHFHVDHGWRNSIQNLQEHLFYFVLNGTIDASVDGNKHTIESGEVVIAPPNSNNLFVSRDGGPIELYRFRLQILSPRRSIPTLNHFVHQSATGCREYFARIAQELESPGQTSSWLVRGLLMALLGEAFREPQYTSTERVLTNAEIRKLREYFMRHHASWPRPAELAAELRLSPDYFTRIFRRSMGTPPRRWMVEERIRMTALALSETDQNVTEIAETFAFSDVFFFSQQFKHIMGCSPLTYRRKMG